MEKVIKFYVKNQEDAYQVIEKLRDLDNKMEISLAETYVLEREENGTVNLKNERGIGLDNTILGGFSGGLIGMFGGPAGFILGSSFGALFGSLGDLMEYDNQTDILQVIGNQMPKGKSLVVSHLYESWTTPIDSTIGELAEIERIDVDEELDKAFQKEIDQFEKDVQEIEEEIKNSNAENKAKLDAKLKEIKEKRDAKKAQHQAKLLAQKKAYKKWFEKAKEKLKTIIT